jgi:hypothetical protein
MATGRSPRPKALRWHVATELIYGQVKKCYRRRKLARVTPVMRLGTEAALQVALQGLGHSGRLNTAFIERVNLTVRHGIAALARRTWATAQQASQLLAHLEWWRAYYHFVRPTIHFEWRSCSHESEVANWRRNAFGNGLQPWPPGEPPDDGRHARYSLVHCHRFPLESQEVKCSCSVMSWSGWAMCKQKKSHGVSLQDEIAYLDCPMTKKPA